MRIVLDTNVLVSGLLNPFGAPGRIVGAIASGAFVVCYDARIMIEYRDVLSRKRFGFHAEDIDALLAQVESDGELVMARPLATSLPDPDDEPFLEVALAAGVDALVTGNKRHFPAKQCKGVRVMTPGDLFEG